jgi:hypothetical protein
MAVSIESLDNETEEFIDILIYIVVRALYNPSGAAILER